jgi:hypothetical protein
MKDILKHCDDCNRIYDKKTEKWIKDIYSKEDYIKITYTCPQCFEKVDNQLIKVME